MSDSKKILVPTDFSPHSRAATERALLFAEAADYEVLLLHSLHLPPVAVDYAFSEAVWTELRASERSELENFRKHFEGRGATVRTAFVEGDPSEAIRSAARASDVELIVMGSHGRRGLDRLVLGSVAERSVHGAPVPVMIVREDEAQAATRIRSILFATDFSEDAELAEKTVAAWARRLGAEVEVFHAIRETAVLFAPYAVPGSSDFEGEMREAASARIEGSIERFREAGVSAKSKLVYGLASDEIIRRAESTGAQLVALGARGYSALRRFLLGSVAQRVLRHAPCSVLVASAASPDPTP